MKFTRSESSADEKAIFKMTLREYHISDFLFGKTDICKRFIFDTIGWTDGREVTWFEKDITDGIVAVDQLEELFNSINNLEWVIQLEVVV